MLSRIAFAAVEAAKEKATMSRRAPSSARVQGKIVAFNLSPKGQIEGALVETARSTVQLNFPKHDAGPFAPLRAGALVDVDAELEVDGGEHPVYRAGAPEASISGTIVRLNYALHGAVNGWHLDDGTFVHAKPDGAKRHRLRVGERIEVRGPRRTGPDGSVLEARSIKRLGQGREGHANA
jgi:hypothetical protein